MSYAELLLSTWAEFTVNQREGLGYSPTTLLDNLSRDSIPGGTFKSRIPRDLFAKGFRIWKGVEKILDDMGDKHRVVAALEYGVVHPNGGKPIYTQALKADAAGISPNCYRKRLRRIRKKVGSDALRTLPETPPVLSGRPIPASI